MEYNKINPGIKKAFFMLCIVLFIFFSGYTLVGCTKEKRKQKNQEKVDSSNLNSNAVDSISKNDDRRGLSQTSPDSKKASKNSLQELEELRMANKKLVAENTSLREEVRRNNLFMADLQEKIKEYKQKAIPHTSAKIRHFKRKGMKKRYRKEGVRIKAIENTKIPGTSYKVKNLTVKAVRIEYDRAVTTALADAVYKLDICMYFGNNVIVLDETKRVYVRIINPKGQLLKGKSDLFESEKGSLEYTTTENLYYENRNLQMCLYWHNTEGLSKGNYSVEVYIDKKKSATATFFLN